MRQLASTIALLLAFTVPVFAGDIPGHTKEPPPPPPAAPTTSTTTTLTTVLFDIYLTIIRA